MFPDSMSPQEVVDAINEAYNNREFRGGNKYHGFTNGGIEVQMYLDKAGKIITAYPIIK